MGYQGVYRVNKATHNHAQHSLTTPTVQAAMTEPTQPVRVALVDDDAHYRALFTQAIKSDPTLQLDFVAETGQKMVRWLAKQCPDVLLIDLGLPDMSGLEVVRFGAQHWPQMNMAVVTMFSDEPNVIGCLESGASGYILKQSLPADIAALVLQLHEGGAPMSPSIARYVLQRLPGRAQPQAQAQNPLFELGADTLASEVLSERELAVLHHVSRGYRVAEIAQLLGVRANTVSSHLKNIYSKLAVHSKTEAVFEASKMGLLEPLTKI